MARTNNAFLAVGLTAGQLALAALADGWIKTARVGVSAGANDPRAALWSYALANVFTAGLLVGLAWFLFTRPVPRWAGALIALAGLAVSLSWAAAVSLPGLGIASWLPMISPASLLAFSASVSLALGAAVILKKRTEP